MACAMRFLGNGFKPMSTRRPGISSMPVLTGDNGLATAGDVEREARLRRGSRLRGSGSRGHRGSVSTLGGGVQPGSGSVHLRRPTAGLRSAAINQTAWKDLAEAVLQACPVVW